MKSIVHISTAAFIIVCLCSFISTDTPQPVTSHQSTDIEVLLDCDTVVIIDGYSVHMIRANGDYIHTGLNLFSDEIKKSMDSELLERIESDLFKLAKKGADRSEIMTTILKGNISDFKSMTPNTDCAVSSYKAKKITVEWTTDDKKKVLVSIPVSYDTAKKGSRSEIEQKFIASLRSCTQDERKVFDINEENLQPYGEDKYLFPGESYLKDGIITRNVYLEAENLKPIWNAETPIESVANLFLIPSDIYPNIDVDLTVQLHEYGKKEVLSIPLRSLLSVCEKDGCKTYWGMNSYENDTIEGALFFLNKTQGYNHVIRVELCANELFGGKGVIKSCASLYIPVNNVDNLFAPDIKRSDKKTIQY